MTLGRRRSLATAAVLVATMALAGCGQLRSLPDPVIVPSLGSPIGALAVSPDGSRVFVTAEDGIDVLDAHTSTVLGTLPVAASRLAVSPDGRWLAFDSSIGNRLIDLTTHLTQDRLSWEQPAGFTPLGVTPDSRRLITTAKTGRGTVLRIFDLASRAEVGSVPIPGDVSSESTIEISPDGRRAYLLAGAISAAQVIAVDLETLQVSPFSLATEARLMQLSPDGSRLYVQGALNMFVVDAATGAVVDEFRPDTFVGDLVISPTGQYLFAVQGVDGGVTVIDTADGSVEASGRTSTIEGEVFPRAVTVAPDGRRLYALTREGLAVIDTSAFL